ncbi:MAG: uroporphyrinogen-III synthase [Helicobacteraceae bacterium]|jgi:uroporphyrinogen-III synthase|nr:uroporphyrinogen-III synthase [Helicobacteraceae bacterium]
MNTRQVVVLSESFVEGAVNLPAIATRFLPAAPPDLTGFDAIIFTSKNAIKALDNLTSDWKSLKVFTVGGESTKAAKKLLGEVFYEEAKSNAADLAQTIADRFADLKFFYPRAKVVSLDIEAVLSAKNVRIKSQILYETISREIDEKAIAENAAIVFSSPSAINSFFTQIKWRESWIAIAIGAETAKILKNYVKNYEISPETSLRSAVNFARDL